MTTLVLLLILIAIWVGFYQLLKQQGRILLRLDAIARGAPTTDDNSTERRQALFEGLPSGTVFPNFELPDLSGKTRALADFRGKRLLIILWNFDCGFCEEIANDLATLETDIAAQNAQIVLLASGDDSFNSKHATSHRLKSLILLLTGKEIPKPFEHQGTPVAYFVDEHAQVAAPFASGADQVLALARRLANPAAEHDDPKAHNRLNNGRSVAETHIERNGLKAGRPAHRLRLSNLQGQTIS